MKMFNVTWVSREKATNKANKLKRFVRDDSANTPEDTTNRGAWWIFGVIIVALLGGVFWYIIGNGASQGQKAGLAAFTGASTQSGLNNMTTQAEGGTGGTAFSAASGNFTAP